MAYGDSISIGFREPGVDCDRPFETAAGYGPHLEQLVAAEGRTIEVVPRGICGELTSQGLSRIDGDLAAVPSDVVILMEGTNDISEGNPPISRETIENNLRQMAIRVDEAGSRPIYASIIPYGPGASRQTTNNERAGLLAADLEQIANQEGRSFADPYTDLLAIENLYSQYYHPDGYHLNAAGYEILADSFVEPVIETLGDLCEPGPCTADGSTLCLQEGRFQVRVDWSAGGESGVGMVQPVSADTGKVWFFSPENTELVIKVLDGRCLNDHFWVFFGALSNVEYRIEVTDTETCRRRLYFNPNGTFASRGDTEAFPESSDSCG